MMPMEGTAGAGGGAGVVGVAAGATLNDMPRRLGTASRVSQVFFEGR